MNSLSASQNQLDASPKRSQPCPAQVATEAKLKSFARFGVDLGLERIETLLEIMGNPHLQVPIIHVAGTNGKGSVCAYLASVLTAAGFSTGRYTSPHLVNWTERICIDGEPISWENLQANLDQVTASIEQHEQASAGKPAVPTQFEVFTAAAWQYFAQQKVDIAIVEVGLGGRLDATNVFPKPLATIVVSIGRDHWQRLGSTLGEIAGEKAGIFKPGVQAIAGPLPTEAAAVVTARATAIDAPLTWITAATEVTASAEPGQKRDEKTPLLSYDGIEYPQALLGDHQKVNSACAIAAIQALKAQGWHIPTDAIIDGMAAVQWPGRLQQTQWHGQPLLIDGAHNRASARSLRSYIDQTYPNQPITWLMGMLANKDHPGVFTELLRSGDHLHLVPVPGHLSAKTEVLKKIAQTIRPQLASVTVHDHLEQGLLAATQKTPQAESTLPTVLPTVLCGSLYLIGHFYEHYAH